MVFFYHIRYTELNLAHSIQLCRHEMCDILKMSHKSRRQARLNVLWSLLRDVCDTLDIVFGAADAAGWGTGEDWNASEAPRCNKIFFRITHDPIL